MINEIEKLKLSLNEIIKEFDDVFEKTKISFNIKKIGEKYIWSYSSLPSLIAVIKIYIYEIEQNKILLDYISALNSDANKGFESGFLEGKDITKLEGGILKRFFSSESYSWVYYPFLKEIISGGNIMAIALEKTIRAKNFEPIKKAIKENNVDDELKEIRKDKKYKKLLDSLFIKLQKPFVYKKFLMSIHKDIMSWLDVKILAVNIQMDDFKEPLTDKWENITIKFIDDKIIKLIIDNKEEDSDYEKLGFADTRSNLGKRAAYVKSWKLLIMASIQNGIITTNQVFINKKTKDIAVKDRADLSQKLKLYFGLNNDPVFYDRDSQTYKIKIKLIPSPDFRDSFLDQKKKIFEFSKKEYLTNH